MVALKRAVIYNFVISHSQQSIYMQPTCRAGTAPCYIHVALPSSTHGVSYCTIHVGGLWDFITFDYYIYQYQGSILVISVAKVNDIYYFGCLTPHLPNSYILSLIDGVVRVGWTVWYRRDYSRRDQRSCLFVVSDQKSRLDEIIISTSWWYF